MKCLVQGHTTQWSGRASNSRPLGYESDMLTTQPLRHSTHNTYVRMTCSVICSVCQGGQQLFNITGVCLLFVQLGGGAPAGQPPSQVAGVWVICSACQGGQQLFNITGVCCLFSLGVVLQQASHHHKWQGVLVICSACQGGQG